MQNRSEQSRLQPLALALRVADGQEGLITLQQVRDCGISDDMLHRLLKSKQWIRVLPGVFRVFGTNTWRARCAAFSLWLGDTAAISHRAAGAWWKFDAFEEGIIELSTTSTRKTSEPEVVIHRVSLWPSSDRGRSGAVWVTSPTRTLIDLAAVCDRDDLEMALESALRRRLTSIARLESAIGRQGGRGRKGIGALRGLLQLRGPDTRPTESSMETRFIQFVRRWRLPEPIRQHVIADGHRRFDFFYPHAQLLIEFDSYEHHPGRKAWSKDQTKGNDATIGGLRTFRVTKELMDDAPRLARQLRRALGQGDLL